MPLILVYCDAALLLEKHSNVSNSLATKTGQLSNNQEIMSTLISMVVSDFMIWSLSGISAYVTVLRTVG